MLLSLACKRLRQGEQPFFTCSNILYHFNTGVTTIKLLDFGILQMNNRKRNVRRNLFFMVLAAKFHLIHLFSSKTTMWIHSWSNVKVIHNLYPPSNKSCGFIFVRWCSKSHEFCVFPARKILSNHARRQKTSKSCFILCLQISNACGR